jgi:hypothetical protein
VFSALALFILLNAGAFIAIETKRALVGPGEHSMVAKYSAAQIKQTYPHRKLKEAKRLLTEMWSRPIAYDPLTQFTEAPFQGEFVNVHAAGFRLSTGEENWPPSDTKINIFVFGGSITFGYNVADQETIPAFLAAALKRLGIEEIQVYNFGQIFYYSTQERALFERLILEGARPDIVIFIDGLSDLTYETPAQTEHLEEFFARRSCDPFCWWNLMPMRKAMKFIEYKILPAPVSKPFQLQDYNKPERNSRHIQRYLDNKKMIQAIADAYNIKALFVWQPVPVYKLGKGKHPQGDHLEKSGMGNHSYSVFGYPQMAEQLAKQPLGENFFWLADSQEELEGLLYVDGVYYSPALSKALGDRIASYLIKINFIKLNEPPTF